MRKPTQHILFAALLLAALDARAQAPSPAPAQGVYPANALRCVVVAGSSVTFADARVQKLTAYMNRSVTSFVNDEFNERHYESTEVFHEPGDVVKTPPQWLTRMARTRCKHLVQIAYESSDDAVGPYVLWEMQVMHLDHNSKSEEPDAVATVGDYKKRYRYPRSEAFLKGFIMSDFAHMIVDDLMASGTLPGLHAAGSVTDADVRAQYDRIVAGVPRTEYAARHILMASQEQAQTALDRIRAGEPFSVVARAASADLSSKDAGGQLEWATANSYAPEFAAAVTALAPRGLAAAPVKTRFGWHVIELTDTRATPIPDFESKREELRKLLAERDRQQAAAR